MASQEQYEQSCRETITWLRNLSNEEAETDLDQVNMNGREDSVPGSSSFGQKVGPYLHCTHHKIGLFSTIYKYHPEGAPEVEVFAIKVTSPSMEQPPHDSRREVRLLSLAAHPNVISLMHADHLQDGHILLKFPFVPFTLEDFLISSQKHISLNTLRDLFSALAHIHEKEILHRDVKPSNILISPLANVKGPQAGYRTYLADFGIAWCATDPASEPQDAKYTDIGTTCYRAPELLFGCRWYREGVDLWSAGCVVAEVLMHNARLDNKEPADGSWTLFDAGDLGSELALVKSIFETLGTPDEDTWPVNITFNASVLFAYEEAECNHRNAQLFPTGVKCHLYLSRQDSGQTSLWACLMKEEIF